MVYFSNLLIGDERGLISSKSSMSVGYSVAEESPLNENNGNWSVDGQPSLKDGNIGEGLLQQASLSLWAMEPC